MIPVECPHCEATFQLRSDVIGKTVRCPECKDVFIVPEQAPAAPPVPPPPAKEVPYERVEQQPLLVAELIDPPTLLDSKPVQPKSPPPSPPAPPIQTAAPLPPIQTASPIQTAKQLPKAEQILNAVILDNGPKEVNWADMAPKPQPSVQDVLEAEAVDVPARRRTKDDDEEPAKFVRRRRSSPLPKILMFGVGGLLAIALIGTLIGFIIYISQAEDRQKAEAEEAYKNGNFAAAKSKYEGLITDYPASSNLERYRFFTALSDLQDFIGSVGTRENPEPGVQRYQDFLKDYGESPFAQPESGFGSDVLSAGAKLCDAIGENGTNHLKKYKEELKRFKTLEEELIATEKAIELGRSQIPSISKYREKEGSSLDAQQKKFSELELGVQSERKRLSVLAPFRNITDDPTAERIELFEVALKEYSLSQDAEAQQMIVKAERRLRELIGPQGRAVLTQRVPQDPFPPLLFASAPAGSPPPRVISDTNPETVFAVAKGILYALDANSGTLLWGVRLGAATADLRVADVPVRVSVGDGNSDWVLIPSELGGRPGLTARLARTGEPVWYQRLEAAPAGRPIVVSGRIYLPLRDKLGTVAEFDLITGTRNGELSVRQPLGGGLTFVPGSRPGENFLIVPGDSRRVFLFEIGRTDDDGNPLPSRAIRVLLTEHPRDSLRGEPLVISSIDEAGPRYLILSQVDGGSGMKLRAFPMPPLAEWIAQAAAENQPTPQAIEVTAPGWAWFPPTTDGERVILATDAGAFVAYGVSQIGNRDKPLFNVPGPKQPSDQEAVTRSQIVSADEDNYWAVLNGQLVRLRTIVDPTQGLRIQAVGQNRTVGEPVHRAQIRSALDLGVIVSRVGTTGNVMAQAFDLSTGLIRWQRRLGFSAAGPAVVNSNGTAVLADEEGGVYAVTLGANRTAMASEANLLAQPFADTSAKAVIAGSPDGSTAWVLAPMLDKSGRRLRVRKIVNGVLKADTSFPLADELAGPAVVLGDSVAVPINNGYVYRTDGSGNQLSVGPLWRGDGAAGQLTCYLTASNNEELLVSDGNLKFSRWRWANPTAKPERLGGPWQTRNPISLAPVAIPTASGERLVAADSMGVLYLFDANKLGEPLRRWRSTDQAKFPTGPVTDRLAVIKDEKRSILVACVDGRHFVALSPDQADPVWINRDVASGELPLIGWVSSNSQILATESNGRVTIIDGLAGTSKLGPVLPGGFAASSSASWISSTSALLPLADGTLIELSFVAPMLRR
jgi:predicted Zn finger-like uncharacterized protein